MRFSAAYVAVAAVWLALPASAADLLEVYRLAQTRDAVYAGARASFNAAQEKIPQGRAGLLPQASVSANTLYNDRTVTFRLPSATASAAQFNSNAITVSITQPLFRRQNWIALEQARSQVDQAEAQFTQAAQELGLRVAQAYFDVLLAQDNVALANAQKTAIGQQLEQAKRNFEVGTATITDTHEAQARFDLSAAQEIAALNDLEVKRRNLQQITGKNYQSLKPLRPDVKLASPTPATMESWVDLAQKQSFAVLAQEAATEVFNLEAKRQQAGHYPTLDLVANYGYSAQTGSAVTALGTGVTQTSIGVQFAVPLYQGGAITSRAREAAANYEKARQDLENARRSSALNSQQSFLGVMNGIAQVRALEAALVSSQSALDSNRLGYEVGVRINIDVLNAQQQLFSTRRDLAVARYTTITNFLKLKSAVGGLGEADLEEYNKVLVP